MTDDQKQIKEENKKQIELVNKKQLEKATLKTQAAIEIIKSIIKINSVLDFEEVKTYEIKLKYSKLKDFYKFFIEIYKGESKPEKIFNIKFSLMDLEKGKHLLGSIIELFAQEQFKYSGFTNIHNSSVHDSFFIKGGNNVNLIYKINNLKDQNKLMEFNDEINKNKQLKLI